MDEEVRFHLQLMAGYFFMDKCTISRNNKSPLPEGIELSEEDINKLSNTLLLQVGITLDAEVNGLLAHLETLMVSSIYKLDLKRPKKSMSRNGLLNIDMIRILQELDSNTLLGRDLEKYFSLLLIQVCDIKV